MSNVETYWLGISIPNNVWLAVELLPVLFAFLAIFYLGNSVKATVGTMRKVTVMALIASTLLIIAQSGWTNAHMNNIPFFKSAFDNVWTIFNVLVMTCFILIGRYNK